MESVEDIVIVGAGIAGLTTALGLHRLGIRSLVLESWNELRVTGFGLTTWTNGWRALDAIGIGDALRQNHHPLQGIVSHSPVSGVPSSEFSFNVRGKHGEHEVRCLVRKVLLESLAKELPQGSIQFGAKVVAIEEAKYFKLVHLADGSMIKSKVLIGCDGVNSVVAKSIGHRKPSFTTRVEIRGFAEFPDGHGVQQKFLQFPVDEYFAGFIPCNQNTIHWFFDYSIASKRSGEDIGEDEDPIKLKQFVLQNLRKVPKEIVAVVEQTRLDSIRSSTLRFRPPLDLLWPGGMGKENICLAGDALHTMTPDIGQGGCTALEDGVILARCLAEVFLTKHSQEKVDEEEYNRIKNALRKYADERRWRCFELIAVAYISGRIFQSKGRIISFFGEKVLSKYMPGLILKRADYDCGKLTT